MAHLSDWGTIYLERVWRKRTLLHCWWECKLVQPLWRTVWRFLKKLKIELQYEPEIPPLGINPEKTIIWKDTCTPVFIAALFTIARTWKQPKCPSTDEWIKKSWNTTQPKKEQITSFAATWMDLEITILGEVTERQISYDITCIRNLKKDTNECTCKTESDS